MTVGAVGAGGDLIYTRVMNRAELDGKFEKEAHHRSTEGSRKMAF